MCAGRAVPFGRMRMDAMWEPLFRQALCVTIGAAGLWVQQSVSPSALVRPTSRRAPQGVA
jgi:hypothetical protein